MKHKMCGFTLLELLITVAIIGILAAVAVPSWSSMIASSRAKSEVLKIQQDLYLAKNEALKRNSAVHFIIKRTSSTDWCIGVATDTSCDCATGTNCIYNRKNNSSNIRLSGTDNSSYRITFDNIRNLPTVTNGTFSIPGNIQISSGSGDAERSGAARLNPVGKVTVCSPSSSTAISGLPAC
ncbi:GspH/FimT family pseudopilin [Chitinibacter tainanensis]|uniref:GspH/FimT family pseudopilin n=1 Tax=Chitinibacter tainanensis TaxID=230667 RepID=UPI0023558DB6|nr:GspH/FimT family pseudopilin [Chitinibacter tainanensis]